MLSCYPQRNPHQYRNSRKNKIQMTHLTDGNSVEANTSKLVLGCKQRLPMDRIEHGHMMCRMFMCISLFSRHFNKNMWISTYHTHIPLTDWYAVGMMRMRRWWCTMLIIRVVFLIQNIFITCALTYDCYFFSILLLLLYCTVYSMNCLTHITN